MLLSSEYSSPTGSRTDRSYAAVSHFGHSSNDLAPRTGSSYALISTGIAEGTNHSTDMGGSPTYDRFYIYGPSVYNVMEWKLTLRAPEGANGIRIHHLFLSQEYDEFIGSIYNDKFYIILKAGSTDGGRATVINSMECRDPEVYSDFICSPGMQFCNPRQPYCYIAINTAASECCWFEGCPDGTATTDISGTGFECAGTEDGDSERSGSSSGWMMTEWPIEPGETFELIFHIHDTGDGIFDSQAIIDGIQFLPAVTPGTWPN